MLSGEEFFQNPGEAISNSGLARLHFLEAIQVNGILDKGVQQGSPALSIKAKLLEEPGFHAAEPGQAPRIYREEFNEERFDSAARVPFAEKSVAVCLELGGILIGEHSVL